MKLFPHYILVLFLTLSGLASADDITLDDSLANESSGYGPECYDGEEDEEADEDEDKIPENLIANMYESGRMAFLFGKFEVAFKAWEPLAQQGYSKAQASLAWMYHTGNGVKKDIKQAIGWYRLAAEQNHAIAQNNLAVFFENGLGGITDLKSAFTLYKKSADSGYAYAQYNLGRMYAEGRGTRKNIKEAIYWWRSASLHKVKEATEALAILENKPIPASTHTMPVPSVAHAPYHANPVVKGLAWVKKQAVNHYTIQLSRSQDLNWILKLAASEQLPQPITQVQSTDPNGEKWYTLIYGSFPSFQDAEIARKELPPTLKKWSPKLVRFDEIHKLINK